MKNRDKQQLSNNAILVLLLIIFLVMGCSNKKQKTVFGCQLYSKCVDNAYEEKVINNIELTEFIQIIDSEEVNVVFVGKSNCKWCSKMMIIIQELMNDDGIPVKYLDINSFTENEKELFEETITGIWDSDKELGVPLLMKIKKGKIVDSIVGIKQYNNINDSLMSLWLENSIKIILEGE